ncbi:head completion protein [bacterium]|nr:head completion protein [bacterium]
MAYKGRYSVKNPSKYEGDPTKVIYRSLWERNAFKWCDDNPNIIKWSSEEVVIPYLYEVDRKYHRYFMDLKLKTKQGKTFLVEIKPDGQTRPPTGGRRTKRYLTESLTYIKNVNKWEAAEEYAKDRGWEFVIWTEKNEPLKSIIPKSTKPLKPIKPFKRRKK